MAMNPNPLVKVLLLASFAVLAACQPVDGESTITPTIHDIFVTATAAKQTPQATKTTIPIQRTATATYSMPPTPTQETAPLEPADIIIDGGSNLLVVAQLGLRTYSYDGAFHVLPSGQWLNHSYAVMLADKSNDPICVQDGIYYRIKLDDGRWTTLGTTNNHTEFMEPEVGFKTDDFIEVFCE